MLMMINMMMMMNITNIMLKIIIIIVICLFGIVIVIGIGRWAMLVDTKTTNLNLIQKQINKTVVISVVMDFATNNI